MAISTIRSPVAGENPGGLDVEDGVGRLDLEPGAVAAVVEQPAAQAGLGEGQALLGRGGPG